MRRMPNEFRSNRRTACGCLCVFLSSSLILSIESTKNSKIIKLHAYIRCAKLLSPSLHHLRPMFLLRKCCHNTFGRRVHALTLKAKPIISFPLQSVQIGLVHFGVRFCFFVVRRTRRTMKETTMRKYKSLFLIELIHRSKFIWSRCWVIRNACGGGGEGDGGSEEKYFVEFRWFKLLLLPLAPANARISCCFADFEAFPYEKLRFGCVCDFIDVNNTQNA